VDGRPDALHEDVGREADAARNLVRRLLSVQVVAAALALRLEHIRVRLCCRLFEDVRRHCVVKVVKSPQACALETLNER